jgi:hypothetical protein
MNTELETNTSTFPFFSTLKVKMDVSYFFLKEMGPTRLLEKGCRCLATKESIIKKLLESMLNFKERQQIWNFF